MRNMCSSSSGVVVKVYGCEISIVDTGLDGRLAGSRGLNVRMALVTKSFKRRNVTPSNMVCSPMVAEIPLSHTEN